MGKHQHNADVEGETKKKTLNRLKWQAEEKPNAMTLQVLGRTLWYSWGSPVNATRKKLIKKASK